MQVFRRRIRKTLGGVMDKISIIVPVFNGEKHLSRCVDSLLNQTYKNIECIFINDGSSDNTLKILKEYKKKDSRVVIIDKKNTGVSDSRNKAIEMSTGDYICFCDADDMYDKNYVEMMHDLIIKEDVPLVRCNYKVIDKSGNDIDKGNILKGLYSSFEIKNQIIPSCLDGTIPCFSYLLMIELSLLIISASCF